MCIVEGGFKYSASIFVQPTSFPYHPSNPSSVLWPSRGSTHGSFPLSVRSRSDPCPDCTPRPILPPWRRRYVPGESAWRKHTLAIAYGVSLSYSRLKTRYSEFTDISSRCVMRILNTCAPCPNPFQRESPYFHAKLCTPVSPGQNPIGTSDQNAFSLDGVKSTDFARFLWVFYNP